MNTYELANNAGWIFLVVLAGAGIILLSVGAWFASVFLLTHGKKRIREEKARKLQFDAEYKNTLEALNQPSLPSSQTSSVRSYGRTLEYN